jgi:hypothetical protein
MAQGQRWKRRVFTFSKFIPVDISYHVRYTKQGAKHLYIFTA